MIVVQVKYESTQCDCTTYDFSKGLPDMATRHLILVRVLPDMAIRNVASLVNSHSVWRKLADGGSLNILTLLHYGVMFHVQALQHISLYSNTRQNIHILKITRCTEHEHCASRGARNHKMQNI